MLKYEFVSDSKDGNDEYSYYFSKRNKQGHAEFIRSHAFELAPVIGGGIKTEVSTAYNSKTGFEKTGQNSEATFAIGLPFFFAFYIKPEYDSITKKENLRVGISLSAKLGVGYVGDGGAEIGVNIRGK